MGEAQVYRSTSYLIDAPAGKKGQTYQIRIDPVGRVVDIIDARQAAPKGSGERKKADEATEIGRASCRERVEGAGGGVSSRRRHTSFDRDWSSDVCSSDLGKDGRGASLSLHLVPHRRAGGQEGSDVSDPHRPCRPSRRHHRRQAVGPKGVGRAEEGR